MGGGWVEWMVWILYGDLIDSWYRDGQSFGRLDAVDQLIGNRAMADSEVRITDRDGMSVEPMNGARETFQHLALAWDRERTFLSSTTEMARCPSYRRIVDMGKDALPLIFEQLRSEGDQPGHWYLALSEITGVDPVAECDYGYVNRMASAWLDWADENGYG